MKRALMALALTTPLVATPAGATQGVTDDEIVLGSIQDLSGPIAGFGKELRNGMTMRMKEINAAGGVNGRKLRIEFEDSAYDPRKAVLAAQKLVNQDEIFAMVGHLGTAQNMAAMPVQFEAGVLNFFPVTAARQMYEPFHRLKYAFVVPYYDQMRVAAPKLYKEKKLEKACAIYQDDEFGLEVVRGAEEGLKGIGVELVEKTTFKRGATDFSSQVARMKAAGCDLVVMGTIIRETIGTIAESRKTGFDPVFLGSMAAYTDLIHKLGGEAMNGMYATMFVQNPYMDAASADVKAWAKKYKDEFGEEPTVFSVYGYVAVDAFARVAKKVGKDLTTDAFIATMDKTVIPQDMFGTPELQFGPKDRLGTSAIRMSQIKDGRWQVVVDYGDM